jgi:isopenicillin-N N-acyltransferase-like protein
MFPILTIEGEPRTRGRQYGRVAAQQIRHSIASYARLFAYEVGRDWEQTQQAALDYIPVFEQHTPDLLDEMCGIAEGAKLALTEIIALNARTELLAGAHRVDAHPEYTQALARNRRLDVPDHGECTTVAATPAATAGGTPLLAQTWDWYGNQRAACLLLRVVEPGRPTILTLTEAGIIAKIGLNSAGVGVSLNILFSQGDGQVPGMAVHVLLRRILQTRSVAEAVAVAGEVRAAASSCVTTVDAGGTALSLEVTPQGVGILEPEGGVLVHTNHCVTEPVLWEQRELAASTASSSEQRFNRARAILFNAHGRIDCDTLMSTLRDHTNAPTCICRHPVAHIDPMEQVESVTGVVIDLTAGVMHIAPGIPCEVPFTAVAL